MPGAAYAAVADILAIGRTLTAGQQEAAEVLLSEASAKLRLMAQKYKKNIDELIADPVTGEDFALAVKSVIVQAVCRALDSAGGNAAVSQNTESIGAYSLTVNYLNAGQSLYFLRSELKDLGLMQQRFGWLDIYAGEE